MTIHPSWQKPISKPRPRKTASSQQTVSSDKPNDDVPLRERLQRVRNFTEAVLGLVLVMANNARMLASTTAALGRLSKDLEDMQTTFGEMKRSLETNLQVLADAEKLISETERLKL